MDIEEHPAILDMRRRPWTVAFYSFRGGVGRTTLAVSTALNLRNAFLLDFDLEAPGIDEFEDFKPVVPAQKGLIEYVSDYLDTGIAPRLGDYVYRNDLPTMRAGRRDEKHRLFLTQIDWNRFYSKEDGYLFFENLKVGVRKEYGSEFMLVDSRTGLTDIGSICTGHLADAVVLVFQPTTAHEQGLVDMVSAIRAREKREERPIPRLYVASKVRRTFENKDDPEVVKLVKALVYRCEDNGEVCDEPAGSRIEGRPDYEDPWDVDATVPSLHYIRNRDRVERNYLPDAFVTRYDEYNPTLLSEEYGFVAHWAGKSRESVEAWISSQPPPLPPHLLSPESGQDK